MPSSPPHAFRSRHALWWALVAMCLVVLGPLIGQVSGHTGGQMHGHHAAHPTSADAGVLTAHHTSSHSSRHISRQANSHKGHATDQGIGLADACGYCSLYQHVPVLTLLLVLAALAGPVRRQGARHRPARGHSRPAIFPQALTRAPPCSP
ncbi:MULTISPECIES: DUF2946 family protein [unclassified Halomonas]|uniref:DUF2946 family protein n=1 Tax=unclassified Halomonas TaxID=2609666 RepID=UPI001C96B0FC|nr:MULTISPECIES: DUF2946 family protein [unclassified Halomonas]MBY5924904.1 DUF2946 family protein [Halomonas sp. DP4Y7-2]MBY6231946.1 DUF2946 family protein [Halomonas sp. DP4Y7-1]